MDNFEAYYNELRSKANKSTSSPNGNSAPVDDKFSAYYNNLRMNVGAVADTRTKQPPVVDPLQQQVSQGAVQGLNKTFGMLQSGHLPEAVTQELQQQADAQQSMPQTRLDVMDQRRAEAGKFFDGNPVTSFIAHEILDPAAHAVDQFRLNNPIGKTADVTSQAYARAIGQQPEYNATTGNKYVDVAAQFVGGTAGYLSNPAKVPGLNVGQDFFNNQLVERAAGTVGSKAQNLLPDAGMTISKDGSQVVSSLLGKTVNSASQGVVKGGIGGVTYAPFQTLTVGGQVGDIPQQMLEQGLGGAAFGGAIGGVSPSLGTAFGRLFSKPGELTPSESLNQAAQSRNARNISGLNTSAQQAADRFNFIDQQSNAYGTNPLALPESAAYRRSQGTVLPANTKPIYAKGDIYQPPVLGLPEGNYVAPTRLRVKNPEEAFQSAYEKVLPKATERMTPPLENRNELAKWVQGHMNEHGYDVSLNEVRKLHYNDLQQLASEIKSRLNPYDVVKKTAGDMGYSKIFSKDQTLTGKVARDARNRAYGVYPESLPNVQEPQLNSRVLGEAAAPVQKTGIRRANAVVNPAEQSARPMKLNTKIGATETPVRTTGAGQPIELPRRPETAAQAPATLNERRVFSSMKQSEQVNPETVEGVRGQGDTTYNTQTNAETISHGIEMIHEKGIPGARQHILEKSGGLNADETAAAFKLLTHYQHIGDSESAAKLGHKLMMSGTENGRAVQINAIFNRMTPEGAVKFAAKIIEDSARGGKLTAEQTLKITEAAKRLQTAVSNKDVARDAIQIISKLQNGEKITAAEADQLKRFAKLAERTVPKGEVRQYRDLKGQEIGTGQKLPVAEQKVRTRDAVTSFTSKQAEAARARIRARRGQLNALPVSEWADYAIIGADHITQGAKTLADFGEKMADDVGRLTYSQLNRVFVDSMERFRRQNQEKYVDVTGKTRFRSKYPTSEVEKIINRALATHEIKGDEAYAIKAKAIELAQMTGREKEMAESLLHHEFQQLTDPTFGKQLASILRSAQLLNPRTTIRNVISNMMFYALDTNVRRASSVVDLATSWKGNREIFWRNAPGIWKHFFGDVSYGAKAGWEGRNPGGFQTQYDLGNVAFNRYGNWFNQIGSFFERSLGAVNKSFDYASANMAMKNELFQLAQAKAYAEGHRGGKRREKAIDYFHTADEKMLEQAKEYGEYMTFQDKNFLSDAAQFLKTKVLNFGKDFGLGNFLLNYPKTPANILMRAIDYSPIGYVKFSGNFIKMAAQKNVNKKTLIQDFMRASGGSSMLWMAYELSKAGLINVLPSKDPDVNSLERSAGVIANSVNVDGLMRYAMTMFSNPSVAKPRLGDTYASMDWAQPMAISASAGAAFAQAQDPSRLQKGINAGSAVTQSLAASMESAGNMSVLKNIKDAIMGRNPYQSTLDRVGQVVASIPAAFVPSVLNQIRNTVDPNIRDAYQGDLLQQTIAQLQNKIPGLSKKLPIRIDTLGNEMKSQFGTGTRALNAFVNPSLMGKYDPNQAAQVILQLISSTGDQTLAPGKPQKSMKINGLQVKLSPAEYQQAQISKGQTIQKFINENMGAFQDKNLPDEAKAGVLKSLLSTSSSLTNADTKLKKLVK